MSFPTHWICECGRAWAYETTCLCGRHVPPYAGPPADLDNYDRARDERYEVELERREG